MTVASILSSVGLAIGSATILLLAYNAYQFYSLYFQIPESPLQRYKPGSNRKQSQDEESPIPWAIISGSSGGIGFGYAQYLLTLGFGVVIFADTAVETAEARLRKSFPNAKIKSFTFNCIRASINDIEKLVDDVKHLPITIHINNVGGAPIEMPVWRPFKENYYDTIEDHWKLNAGFMTHFTRLMIPHLTSNSKALGCRSLVLNVTSAGRIGLPLMMMYGSTKGYVSTFSHTLSREMKLFDEPIDCLLIVPGDVISTGNTKGMQPNSPFADDYAKTVLDRVDGAVARELLEISPYWKHALQVTAFEWLPEHIIRKELWKVMIKKKDAWDRDE
jgi:17beta-estradiol 17-dehydrogenase / very-long-chain 3-oxoacyl-CoA reductase